MLPSARNACWLAGSLALLAIFAAFFCNRTVSALEHLRNGGFESGVTSWAGLNFNTTACEPRAGAAAGSLLVDGSLGARVQQTVDGYFASEAHLLSGYTRIQSGAAGLQVVATWLDSAGNELNRSRQPLAPVTAWTPLQVTLLPPEAAVSMRISFEATAVGGVSALVCLDDLSLDGPPLREPTATPTPTPTPTSTTVATPSSTPPGPSHTPTRTPTAISTQATPTSMPTAAAVTISPLLGLLHNGDFEQGLAGWLKFGGELRLVAEPARSGQACAFFSDTASTKWAYQVVRVQPGETYEFAGYLLAGPGVREAYLRLSWYESADGSGAALASDDSTSRINSAADPFTYITTGPRTAPAGANSARARVMLAPMDAGPAVLYFDDLVLRPAEPSGPAPQLPATETATTVAPTASSHGQAATPTPSPSPRTQSRATATRQAPTAVAEVARGDSLAAPGPALPQDPPLQISEQSDADGSGSPLALAAVALTLFFGSMAGVYVIVHGRPPWSR